MHGIVGAGLAPALVAIKNKSWSGAAILMTFSLFQKESSQYNLIGDYFRVKTLLETNKKM